jgi:2-methylisocitrate lyase-like PEP mutase family enzyme
MESISSKAATKLRQLLAQKDTIIIAPGVYDGFSARVALNVGFDCLYMARSNLSKFN